MTTRPVPTKPQTKRTPSVIPQTPSRTSSPKEKEKQTNKKTENIVGKMLEFVLSLRSGLVLSLVVCGEAGPSTASLANQAPVYRGCPAGTHGCDLVSRVRLDQNANPVVVWLGLVSRVREVIVETWNMRKSQQYL